MRGYFHPNSAVPVRDCLGKSKSSDTAACYAFGCMPSLIRDGRDAKIECAAGTGSLTGVPRHPGWVLVLDTKGTMPYHTAKAKPIPGPMLPFLQKRMGTFDLAAYLHATQGPESAQAQRGMPEPTGRGRDVWLLPPKDAPDAPRGDASTAPEGVLDVSVSNAVPQPEYAFERWDILPDEKDKRLQPVERISVRDWVGRLPAGHGPVSEAVLAKCEAALSRLNVTLSRGARAARELTPGPRQVDYQSAGLPPTLVMTHVRLGKAASIQKELGNSKGKLDLKVDKPKTKRGKYSVTILKKQRLPMY